MTEEKEVEQKDLRSKVGKVIAGILITLDFLIVAAPFVVSVLYDIGVLKFKESESVPNRGYHWSIETGDSDSSVDNSEQVTKSTADESSDEDYVKYRSVINYFN